MLDGIPKILPGSHPKALHLNDLRPVFVQKEDVHIGVEPAFSNEFFQNCFRQSHDIHRLLACKVDELTQLPRFALLIIAEQGRRDLFHPVYGISGRMDTSGLPTAWASGRNDFLSGVAVPIQIFLHMGNDLVPLAHLDTASWHQFQILNEGEVMEACPGYRAAIDLHRVKDRHRRDFPCAAGRPFNRTQDGFIGVVLELER